MRKFLRFGQIHRNTYVNAPQRAGRETLSLRRAPRRSTSRGSFRGLRATPNPSPAACLQACMPPSQLRGMWLSPRYPVDTGARLPGALHYPCNRPGSFQPANITFDLLLPLEESLRKTDSRQAGEAPLTVRACSYLICRVVAGAGAFHAYSPRIGCFPPPASRLAVDWAFQERTSKPIADFFRRRWSKTTSNLMQGRRSCCWERPWTVPALNCCCLPFNFIVLYGRIIRSLQSRQPVIPAASQSIAAASRR